MTVRKAMNHLIAFLFFERTYQNKTEHRYYISHLPTYRSNQQFNMMTRSVLIIVSLFIAFHLQAQQESSLNFQHNLWQANRLNPAFLPDAKLAIGLPSLSNQLNLDNNGIGDWLAEDSRRITLDQALVNLEAENTLRNTFELETISVGTYFNDWHISVHHALKLDAFIDFPKTLAQVIGNGNAQFIGETVNMSHNYQAFSYSEFGLGIGYQISEQLSIGARIKYLNGIGDISTEKGSLFLTTDEEIYALSLNTDYRVNASSLLDYNGLNDTESIVELNDLTINELFTANNAIALDFGAHLQLDAWHIGLSILDIGGINWTENVRNYTANDTYEYGGLDLVNAYLENEVVAQTILDSLNQIFEVQETQNSYQTLLPRTAYVHLSREWEDNWQAGVVLFGEWYQNQFSPALSVQAQRRFGELLSVGASYSLYDGRFDQLGVNVQTQIGPVQLYAITHQALSFLRPRESSVLDFRVGANLLFGEK